MAAAATLDFQDKWIWHVPPWRLSVLLALNQIWFRYFA